MKRKKKHILYMHTYTMGSSGIHGVNKMSCFLFFILSVFYTSNILLSFANLSVSYCIVLYFCFVVEIMMYSILRWFQRSVYAINLLNNNDERNKSVSVCFCEWVVILSHILNHFSHLWLITRQNRRHKENT